MKVASSPTAMTFLNPKFHVASAQPVFKAAVTQPSVALGSKAQLLEKIGGSVMLGAQPVGMNTQDTPKPVGRRLDIQG